MTKEQQTALSWVKRQEEVADVTETPYLSTKEYEGIRTKTLYKINSYGDVTIVKLVRFEDLNLIN